MQNKMLTSWVEVNLDAIRHNFRRLKELASPAHILAVVKSEAYGHGLEQVALALSSEGTWGYGVVCAEEVERLRKAGIKAPILIIAPTPSFMIKRVIMAGGIPAVYSWDFAQELSREAVSLGKQVDVHIAVDTGMGRLSLDSEQVLELALKVAKLPNLHITGIYSHLAAADGFEQEYTKMQVERFSDCVLALEESGMKIPWQHLAASAGIMLFNRHKFNLTRAGIALYGLWPSREQRLHFTSRYEREGDIEGQAEGEIVSNYPISDLLWPALSFKTRVMQVKQLPAGSCISYGCTYTCRRDTTVALLPIGYADGYNRLLSNRGEVLVCGRRAPIMGRVCMNLCMIDITDIPNVNVNDEVVLLGSQGKETISADEIAAKLGTINYEVVTCLPMHLPRVYVEGR